MPRIILACLLLAALTAAIPVPEVSANGTTFTPLLDLRVRQEVLDGVYHFAPDPDRNWIRVRTRAGGRLDLGAHRFELRLANEHRHYITPDDQDFSWDEVIIDRGFWSWKMDVQTRLTVGRQDIIWPGGFLMLEGHPYDGSRSIYHNAVRLQSDSDWGKLDGALIYNPKYDDIVLVDDKNKRLTDADETGAVLRLVKGSWAWSVLYKYEDDPDEVLDDLATVTLGGRYDGQLGDEGKWHAELAGQYQDGTVMAAADDAVAEGSGWALAGEAFFAGPIGRGWTGEAGAFYYSGLDGDMRPFRAPWGRWPKWSELYIYTLIGESTPGRVNVAAWENIAAPKVTVKRLVTDWLDARLAASYLLAPAGGDARGLLTQVELKADMGRGFKGHLLWEMLDPGSYHDGRYGLPPLTDTVHFLRWQVSWAL